MIRRIAVMMDDIAWLNLAHDNTFMLMASAAKRGAEIFYFLPENLYAKDDAIFARGQIVTIGDNHQYTLSGIMDCDMANFDVALIRQNPPVTMAYLTTTYLLQRVAHRCLVLNDPQALRDWPEKIIPLQFPDFIPPSMVAQEYDLLAEFYAAHKDIVLKPIYGRHGQRVFRVKPGDENFESIARTMLGYGEPIIAQKFLDGIFEGSKRVVMIDGEVIAAMRNVPPAGSILSGFADRSPYQKTELDAAEKKICASLAPFLQNHGLFLAGVDLIGGKLIEVNVTSPSGLIPIQQLYGRDAASIFWDKVDIRRAKIPANQRLSRA